MTNNQLSAGSGETRPRRDFLRGLTAVAAAGGATAVLSGQTGSMNPSPANDINVLNFALTLEYLEATFYTQGLQKLSSADFQNSEFGRSLQQASGIGDMPPSGISGTGLIQDVYPYLALVRNHEQAHVRTLVSVIRSLGGTPVDPPRFEFPYTNADQFIAIAGALENTGVAAYNGALPLLSNPQLITAGATIATVEARHAAYINRLRGMSPFPDAFDAGKTMAEILEIAGPFIAR